MKKYTWNYTEQTVNEETEEAIEVAHTVTLRCSFLSGKAIVTIDGTEFNISTRPLALRGTSQVFRLGDTPAILDFPKKGAPSVIVDNEKL